MQPPGVDVFRASALRVIVSLVVNVAEYSANDLLPVVQDDKGSSARIN